MITHSELVSLGAKWLQKKCSVVITELVTTGEIPDVIGWHGTHSTLIECKASRSDFLADQTKFFRREQWAGIGMARYYFAPKVIEEIRRLEKRPLMTGQDGGGR